MASPMGSTFSPTSSPPSSNTSLPPISAPQAGTLVILSPIVLLNSPTSTLVFRSWHNLPRLLIILPYIIKWHGFLVLCSSLSFIFFLIISQMTLRRFTTHVMLIGHNQTQPSSLECFIVLSRASSSLLCASSQHTLPFFLMHHSID